MPRVKEVADISKEIIKKLDQAITETINARIFYENYKSLLDEAKKIHEQKNFPLWNEVYNSEATTREEQE
jgi:CO dehydrogenase/acetyl-CoA synthase beta subunit